MSRIFHDFPETIYTLSAAAFSKAFSPSTFFAADSVSSAFLVAAAFSDATLSAAALSDATLSAVT
jgi:uncharacterized protein YjbI with pentapeptide repeats